LAKKYRLLGAGVFFMFAAMSLLILSIFGQGQYEFGVDSSVSPWILIHLLLAFFAFAVFLVSFMIGLAFIFLESRIKAKNLDGWVRRLPSLEVLDGIHYKALGLGLILLTIAIVAGTILNKTIQGVFFSWDPKQFWVFLTWFLYVVLLEMRMRAGWRGRKGVILSVLGFVIIILVFFGLQHGAMGR
jgi:ABC-type transport system involved in cytochrome c biogenesis permease subunit